MAGWNEVEPDQGAVCGLARDSSLLSDLIWFSFCCPPQTVSSQTALQFFSARAEFLHFVEILVLDGF